LWSIAAGPLVNVILAPILFGLVWFAGRHGWPDTMPDVANFILMVTFTNTVLLVFNLLPVYPLDGGQIVQSLLWFWLGRARSLYVSAILGLVGVAGFVAYALWRGSWWMGIMALFLGQRCMAGLQHARGLQALAKAPRHPGFACPSCHEPPPGGPMWLCGSCHQRFNPFATAAVCPHCGVRQPTTMCAFCGAEHPIEAWSTSSTTGVPPVIDI
jgi:hypothetical protein